MDAHITATFSLLPFAAGKFSVLEARDTALHLDSHGG